MRHSYLQTTSGVGAGDFVGGEVEGLSTEASLGGSFTTKSLIM